MNFDINFDKNDVMRYGHYNPVVHTNEKKRENEEKAHKYKKVLYEQIKSYKMCASNNRNNYFNNSSININQFRNTRFNIIKNIPLHCEWCNNDIITFSNNLIYYYNTITHDLILCNNCGSKVNTQNKKDDLIFCYKMTIPFIS